MRPILSHTLYGTFRILVVRVNTFSLFVHLYIDIDTCIHIFVKDTTSRPSPTTAKMGFLDNGNQRREKGLQRKLVSCFG